MVKKIAITVLCVLALVGYTRLIWLSGFDQGADVALCVVDSYREHNATQVADTNACHRASDYQDNILWQLRRRRETQ